MKRALIWLGGRVVDGLLWVIGYRRDRDDNEGPFG
jgi:hypothetical protein